jgi:chaperonin GroES
MALKAFGSTILIKKEKDSERQSGGILIPDSVQDSQCARAKVISVGGGALSQVLGHRVETGVQEGLTIYVNKFAGQTLTHEGEEFTAIVESDIVAVDE